jgi:murein DD-endopeptidase MepM/ murein hydrolase activator NlpD
MKKPLLVTFFLVILVVLFGTRSFVFSADIGGTKDDIQVLNSEIAARKDKIKQLEETMNKYKKNIEEKETQAVSLKNQLSILDNRTAQIKVDLELTEEKIKETQLEIDALNLSINDKKKVIAKQKKIIAKMVENIQASDQKNFMEIMLTYNNFADFYNEVRSTESVYVDLGRSVKSLRLATEDLQARQDMVKVKQGKFVQLKNELEGKKGELDIQQTAKQQLLAQTKSSEARYQTLLSSLKQQYQVIENEQRSYEDRLKKKLEQEDKIAETGSVLMSWPVPSKVINAEFHDAGYPFKKVFEHSGIDIKAGFGTPVKAAASGYVARARKCSSSSCYAYVLVVHTGNISSVYGHLSTILVSDDQYVNRGDVIGYSGGTPGTIGAGPFVTGPHLHFEVRSNGIPVDPMPYMAP